MGFPPDFTHTYKKADNESGGVSWQREENTLQSSNREAVQLVRSANVPASQVARDLGDRTQHAESLVPGNWALIGNKAFQGQGKPRDEETAVS